MLSTICNTLSTLPKDIIDFAQGRSPEYRILKEETADIYQRLVNFLDDAFTIYGGRGPVYCLKYDKQEYQAATERVNNHVEFLLRYLTEITVFSPCHPPGILQGRETIYSSICSGLTNVLIVTSEPEYLTKNFGSIYQFNLEAVRRPCGHICDYYRLGMVHSNKVYSPINMTIPNFCMECLDHTENSDDDTFQEISDNEMTDTTEELSDSE
jgi:hypothetical protein